MDLPEFRFNPPPVTLDEALQWALTRAFGPVGRRLPPPSQPELVLQRIREFDLAPRIASRHPDEHLIAELGAASAREVILLQMAARAEGVRLDRTAATLVGIAAELDLPIAFLKYQALRDLGVLQPGARFACDIDLLLPRDEGERLAEALLAEGFEAGGYSESEHQLDILVHSELCPVEIHRLIPGVRVTDSGRSARFEDLERADLLQSLPHHAGRCYAPTRPALRAHILVHGIAQHGSSPSAYSMTRMLGDLIDLGSPTDANIDPGSIGTWVGQAVSPAEIRGVDALCDHLVAGEVHFEATSDGERNGERLLRHIVAGALDAQYRQSLRLKLHRTGITDRPTASAVAHRLWRAVFKTRAELDAIYGPSRSSFGYVLRRLYRPIDLIVRLLRYGGSRLAVGLRSARDR